MAGPDADRAAYDVAAFWARAGLAEPLTRPGDTPPFQRGGMGDHSAGMTLAAAVCAALLARNRTGTGQLVTTSLYRQGCTKSGSQVWASPTAGGKHVAGSPAPRPR